MKRILIKYILFSIVIVFSVMGCNDSFLDRTPTHDISDDRFWKTADDLKAYNNGIYNSAAGDGQDFFQGYGVGGFSSSTNANNNKEVHSDNAASKSVEQVSYANLAAGLVTVPATGGDWDWGFLRQCNVFFANYEKAEILPETRNRYAGEVYFWRAWFYLDKVQKFGDVPYVTKPLDIESPELYGARDPRKTVMDSVLRDIDKAIEFLPQTWPEDHPSRITKGAALALKSRICLYEGTYRKYHGLGDHEKFLTEAVNASQELIQSNQYSIYSTGNPDKDLRTLFISQDLTQNPEVILPFIYDMPGAGHGVSRYITATAYGMTKDLVDDFLCIEPDGTAKPIALSSVYRDDVYDNVFDNRDPRLAQTVLDPKRELEIMNTEFGYPGIGGIGPVWQSPTGYHFIKFYDVTEIAKTLGQGTDDYPVLRYAEVLLNYAEAKAELGTLNQSDLDISVNKLRDRVNMPYLTTNPPMDPKYAGEGIPAILVEIRRERRVEFAGEDFRYQDLMRWKQGSKLKNIYLGARVEDADIAAGGRFAGAKLMRVTVDGKQYIDAYGGTNYAVDRRVFDENRDYLRPIAINVMTKNPQITQNPGWTE